MAGRSAQPPHPEGLDRETLIVAGVVLLGAIMSILDTTVVNVAIDHLAVVFHSSLTTIQWVITGYTLALAAVIPVAGWAADRFGTKRIYMWSLVFFTLGSMLSGRRRPRTPPSHGHWPMPSRRRSHGRSYSSSSLSSLPSAWPSRAGGARQRRPPAVARWCSNSVRFRRLPAPTGTLRADEAPRISGIEAVFEEVTGLKICGPAAERLHYAAMVESDGCGLAVCPPAVVVGVVRPPKPPLGVTRVRDPAIIVVVVDDYADDELVSVLARASRVPAAHLRASWAFELTGGQVQLTLADARGHFRRDWDVSGLTSLAATAARERHYVGILPDELAGDVSSPVEVCRLAGSAVVQSSATTALTMAWMLTAH